MAVGATSISANSMTVGAVLEERYPLFVPLYQRAYAWDDEAVGDFVNDLKTLLGEESGVVSHFFGGVVCIQVTDRLRARPLRYEVVDGQQRLATFILALSCVVELADQLSKVTEVTDGETSKQAAALREDIEEKYVLWKELNLPTATRTPTPRLELSRVDNEVFQSLISGTAPPTTERESHRLLVRARGALFEMASEYVNVNGPCEDQLSRLVRIRDALVTDSYVIHIFTEERSQAYRLFSVLNHRGVSLSDADLLRSRTLELLADYPSQHERVAELWDEMLAESPEDVEQFVKACYTSRQGSRPQGDLYDAVTRAFLPAEVKATAHADKVVEVVSGLRDELTVFVKLKKGVWPYSSRTAKAWEIDRLKRLILTLKHELALPLLLSAAIMLPESDFAEMVYMLEVFSFRYKIIGGGHATRMQRAYYPAAEQIRNSGSAYKMGSLRAKLKDILTEYSADSLFRQQLTETLRYDNAGQRGNIRELLTTISDHHEWLARPQSGQYARPKPSMNAVFDLDLVTLEHIYPQNADASDIDPELEKEKHRLGNLTILGSQENDGAGNKPFFSKKSTCYTKSTIPMTRALASIPTWMAAQLRQREIELVGQALRVFVL
jgi:hypothetical protein